MLLRSEPGLYRYCENVVPFAVIITVMHFNMAWLVHGAAPRVPSNLTVTYVTNNFAIATWRYTGGSDQPVSKFEMTICPVRTSSSYRQRDERHYCMLIPSLEPYVNSVRLEKLQPATVYFVYMTAVYDDTYSNKSNNVSFATKYDSGVFRAGDACVVLIVIVMWIVAVVLFLQKWASIRIVQPRDRRYKFKPKNLDNVKVVKKATDSVIYKSYSRQLSFTMEKREQKLERMNTLQNIQVEQDVKDKADRDAKLKQMTKKERKEEKECEKKREVLAKEVLREAREKMRERERELDKEFKEKQKLKDLEKERVRLEKEEFLRSDNRGKERLKAQTSLPVELEGRGREKIPLKEQVSLRMENIREKDMYIPRETHIRSDKPCLGENGTHTTNVQIETAASSKHSDSAVSGNISTNSKNSEQTSSKTNEKQSNSELVGAKLPETVIHDSNTPESEQTVVVMMTTST